MPNTAENIVTRIYNNVEKLVSFNPIKLFSSEISISKEQDDFWVTIVRPKATSELPKETIYGISKENNCIYSSVQEGNLSIEDLKEFDEKSTRMLALIQRKQNKSLKQPTPEAK